MKDHILILMLILLCACTAHAQDTVKTSRSKKMQQARERMHQQRMAANKKREAEHPPRKKEAEGPRFARYYREDSATRSLFAYRYTIRVTPTSLIDFNGPCLPVGIEYRMRKIIALALEVAIPMPYKNVTSPVRNNSSGKTIRSDLRLRLELRKYFVMKRNRRAFLGIEAYMRQQQFTQANGYYDGPRVFHVYNYTSADITKFHAGLAPFIGSSFKLGDHLFFDAHFGIGLRYLENKYSHINGLTQGGRNSMGALFVPEDELYGHMWRPYMAVGLKLGYML